MIFYMSCITRETAFCICENKGADQLHDYRAADQLLFFRYIGSTIPPLLKSEIQASSYLLCLCSSVCIGPGQKPEDRFSRDTLYMIVVKSYSW